MCPDCPHNYLNHLWFAFVSSYLPPLLRLPWHNASGWSNHVLFRRSELLLSNWDRVKLLVNHPALWWFMPAWFDSHVIILFAVIDTLISSVFYLFIIFFPFFFPSVFLKEWSCCVSTNIIRGFCPNEILDVA